MEGFLDDWNTAEKDSGSPDRSPEDFWELRIHMILTRENNSQHFTTCFYVPFTWLLHGFYIDFAWNLHGIYMEF